jgi:AhpD family alkylhydroperoxidase
MSKNYPEIIRDITSNARSLRGDIPEVLKAFGALTQAAQADGALDRKTKELIALAIGVHTQCDGCIGYHAEALVKYGATRKEVAEAVGVAIQMGGGPAVNYAADAISAFDQFSALKTSV